jgi:hypothetical protein
MWNLIALLSYIFMAEDIDTTNSQKLKIHTDYISIEI